MLGFIHIRSNMFPILDGETDDIVNGGTYGKALSQYLQKQLSAQGYNVTFCCEDWGWWVEIGGLPFTLAICIYSHPEQENPTEYVCTDSLVSSKKWSWKKFGYIRLLPAAEKLFNDLQGIFTTDPDIEVVQITQEMPF